MDTNLIGLAIAVIGGAGGIIIGLFSKISKLEGRLETLASENRLQEQVDKIQSESIRKLQQRATELHDTTQTQVDRLATDIAQQQTQVNASLQVLKTQEASSLAVMGERAQQLLQTIEQSANQIQETSKADVARLKVDLAQQREQSTAYLHTLSQQTTTFLTGTTQQLQQLKQAIEQEMTNLQQQQMSTRIAHLERLLDKRFWWFQLDTKWQALFKSKTGLKSEPTEVELLTIFSLTELNCYGYGLTNLEPLQALTGLQTLDCSGNNLTNLEPLRHLSNLWGLNCSSNQITSLEPLRGLRSLRTLDCNDNPLPNGEIELFKTAVPTCQIVEPTSSWSGRIGAAVGGVAGKIATWKTGP